MTAEVSDLALLDQVPRLSSRVLVEELSGGLTNRNYKVVTPDGTTSCAAAAATPRCSASTATPSTTTPARRTTAGSAREVFDYRPDLGMLVIGYLPGRSLENDDFADPGVLTRAAEACRRLHAGPRFTGEFDMFARQAAYRQTVREEGFALPRAYDDHADAWAAVQRVVGVRPRVDRAVQQRPAGRQLHRRR